MYFLVMNNLKIEAHIPIKVSLSLAWIQVRLFGAELAELELWVNLLNKETEANLNGFV
jgi:hypothetical protein